jgi:hypothetical protein
MIKYFLWLCWQPQKAVEKILEERITFLQIAVFLFFVGALRACLESVWLYARLGKLPLLFASLASRQWLAGEFAPFLIGNIFTAYFRWAMFSCIVFFAGRFIQGKGKFRDILKIYGIVLGSYLLSPFFNFLHLAFNLPYINFYISPGLTHPIGLGQVILGAWSAWVAYTASRKVHCVSRPAALCIGALVPLFDRAAFIISSIAFFNIAFIKMIPAKMASNFATAAFLALSFVMIPFFLWAGCRIDKKEKAG